LGGCWHSESVFQGNTFAQLHAMARPASGACRQRGRVPARKGTVPLAVPAPAAQGYFPRLVEEEPLPAPEEEHELQETARSSASDVVTLEVRLLREQTARLVQEARLLGEALQKFSPSSLSRVRPRERGVATSASPAMEDSAAAAPASPTHDTKDPGGAVTFNDIMTERKAGVQGYRHDELTGMLEGLGGMMVRKRQAGELPLGQVPAQR